MARLQLHSNSFNFLPLLKSYINKTLKYNSLALLDRNFSFFLGRRKKGMVNSLYQFCSANPHFLGVDNWPLMASDKRQRAECM